ncbi:MAG: hypothetical protein JWN70_5073 [Planctomycetaceae bacterium]|nr:hypothetical protein [Planctomycetaceae bacterium]
MLSMVAAICLDRWIFNPPRYCECVSIAERSTTFKLSLRNSRVKSNLQLLEQQLPEKLGCQRVILAHVPDVIAVACLGQDVDSHR